MISTMTKLMGILNVTPDSFFDKGHYFSPDKAIERGNAIYREGADILDIGGESTRPGSTPVTLEEELNRVIPVIQSLHSTIPIPISIDTNKPKVAHAAIEAGATFLNDVCGFQNPEMQEIAATTGLDICVMHMQGTPQNMQKDPHYSDGVISSLLQWFEGQISCLLKRGVKEKQIILDPGIGFGKTVDDNLKIIQNLAQLKALGFPLLVGISRKSFMGKILNKKPPELLPATLAVNTLLINANVDIIRVHDVLEHRDVIILLKALNAER